MSEVYLLVAFVFLAVAAVRLLMSICSSLRKKNGGKHGDNYRRDLDIFVIDMGTSANNQHMRDEQPPPTYEDAVRYSFPLISQS